MEENLNQEKVTVEQNNSLHQVTPLSKYLAMILFVALPFIGGWVGYNYAPEKVVEVEKVVFEEKNTESSKADSSVNGVDAELDENIIATTTVDMGEYKIRYSSSQIEVLDKLSRVKQVIPWDTSFRKVFSSNDALLITNRDINYDHYLDLGFLYGIGYGGVNRVYNFYVYNPNTQQLEIVEGLGSGSGYGGVVNPTFDIPNKSITSNAKSAQEWIHTEFIFDGEKYIKGESWSEGWE